MLLTLTVTLTLTLTPNALGLVEHWGVSGMLKYANAVCGFIEKELQPLDWRRVQPFAARPKLAAPPQFEPGAGGIHDKIEVPGDGCKDVKEGAAPPRHCPGVSVPGLLSAARAC